MHRLNSFLKLEKVESTNDIAKESGLRGERGLVVSALYQNAGRGRNGREWISSGGGLYLSIVIEKTDLLPFRTALAVSEVIDGFLGSGISKIKWPNDVLVRGKKISGILCEGFMNFDVAGIGINVNNEVTLECTTSLGRELDRNIDLNYLLSVVAGSLNKWLTHDDVLTYYRKKCATMGRRVRVLLSTGEVSGIADMDEKGFLLVDGRAISVYETMRVEKD